MSDGADLGDGEGDTDSDGGLAPAEQRAAVRERYGAIAESARGAGEERAGGDDAGGDACCGSSGGSADAATDAESDGGGCCTQSGASDEPGGTAAERLGYTAEDVAAVAEGADLGLGCGNPTAIAALSEGEDVVDLGSGGGFDCFLAAREVGPTGRVVGVDMTPDMVELARENAAENDVGNVDFRLGEIEHLPLADASVDVVLSNCVVNLSPDKSQVFREAFRVLRPGGRLAISDVVSTVPIPDEFRDDPASVSGCVAGAATVDDLEAMLSDVGFEDVSIEPKDDSREFIGEWSDERDLSDYILSAVVEGRKPA